MKVEAKPFKEGTWLELKKAFVQSVFNSYKFMDCKDDELTVISLCLPLTNEWAKIKDLDEEDLDAEVQSHVDACGHLMTSDVNIVRLQSAPICHPRQLD